MKKMLHSLGFGLIIALCVTLWISVDASLPASGSCSLFTFVPFSYGSEPLDSFECGKCNNVGVSHAAAALIAIEHFNARNNSVVPELDQFLDCPVQFDEETSKIFDTGSYTHLAAETLLAQLPELPCAVAGPFHDTPTLELSTLAASLEFPVTAHRAYSLRALAEQSSPYTSQVFPELITYAQVLASYLVYKGRDDFVAFVYSLTETGLHRRETVAILLDDFGIRHHQEFAYNSERSPATSDQRSMQTAFQGVIDSGYRTVVLAPELSGHEIPLLAHTAVKMGLTNNSDYMWIWFGDFDPLWNNDDPIVRGFLEGSIFITPLEGHHLDIDGTHDPFVRAWLSQGSVELERLKPVIPENVEFVPKEDYFNNRSEWGAAFMYDAVMTTGMGACLALASTTGSNDVPIESFIQGIHSVNFTGATGVVRFCREDCDLKGSRDPYSYVWGILNNYPPGVEMEDPWELTEIFYFPEVSSDFIFPNGSLLYDYFPKPQDLSPAAHNDFPGQFMFIHDTIFADGRTVPPDLLRETPEQNYLSRGIRAIGFTLVGIAMLTAVASSIWVFIYRDHRVVRAAQPYFLYLICFGATVSVSAIITLSFDESYGWSEEQLSRACMATPWLSSLGHIFTYGALFSKLWRVNRVLQFVRRNVDIFHVIWPSAILAALALVVLGLWTGLDSLTWIRSEINPITGESIGQCSSNNAAAFIVPLAFILLVPMLLAFYMAWKTNDVDEAYSESRWIFIMVLIQLEVLLFAAPLIPLLYDVSTNGRYIGYALLIFSFPMSTLCLIIFPKMVAVHRKNSHNGPKRGEFPGQVHVSGISPQPLEQRTSSTSHQRQSHNTQSEGTQMGLAMDPTLD